MNLRRVPPHRLRFSECLTYAGLSTLAGLFAGVLLASLLLLVVTGSWQLTLIASVYAVLWGGVPAMTYGVLAYALLLWSGHDRWPQVALAALVPLLVFQAYQWLVNSWPPRLGAWTLLVAAYPFCVAFITHGIAQHIIQRSWAHVDLQQSRAERGNP